MTTWGIASTILAPAQEILRFAAFHLEAGAAHIRIYLDDDNAAARDALGRHPSISVVTCDAAHWQSLAGKRPDKHQLRQTVNATHAYSQSGNVDWMIHIDVDEFLISDQPIAQVLAGLPDGQQATRIRPMEALAGDGSHFKAFIPPGRNRARTVASIYPNFGRYLKGGFVSHVAGKPFLRTGRTGVKVRIHQAFQNDTPLSDDERNPHIDMAHCHAKSWDQWIAHYRYRLEKGSYRSELGPARPRDKGGLNLHELFQIIEAEEGEPGLRAFYDEVCADTPALRRALQAAGLLRHRVLSLESLTAKHFPDASTV